MSLLHHSDTAHLIASLTASATQALLIVGEQGSGSHATAEYIADTSLIDTIEPTDIKGNIDHAKGSVRIIQIRTLSDRVKTASQNLETIIIDRADTMGAPAQNAFLKLLEEPRSNLRFILTAHSSTHILPTILSRVQRINLRPISRNQSSTLITELGITDTRTAQQILFLAEGLPAEIYRLASSPDYFSKQIAFAGDARTFMQGSLADRVVIANRYHSDRADALVFLAIAQRILSHSLNAKPSRDLITSLDRYSKTYEAIAAGGNVRLQLLACVV